MVERRCPVAGDGPERRHEPAVRTDGERERESDMVAVFLTIGLAVFATFVLFRGSKPNRH